MQLETHRLFKPCTVCTINCYAWTHMTMMDVDVGSAATRRDIWQLFPCNHALAHMIM